MTSAPAGDAQAASSMIRFSIIVPSYKQARFLPACLDSILSQKNGEVYTVEVLIYDGGSDDGSADIIRAAAEQHPDAIVYWQSQPDGGQAAAIREGFSRATGDVIGWLNSDDILLPGGLQQAAEAFQKNPDAVMIYGDAVWIDEHGKLLQARREIEFDWNIFAYGYCFIPQPSTFFRRDAYEQAGGVDPSFHCCMDYDLWHRLARCGTVKHGRGFWAAMREHGETKTQTLPARFREEDEKIRRAYVTTSTFKYRLLHPFCRLLRIAQRLRQGGYRPLSESEQTALGL